DLGSRRMEGAPPAAWWRSTRFETRLRGIPRRVGALARIVQRIRTKFRALESDAYSNTYLPRSRPDAMSHSLKHPFSAFLRRRHVQRHFARRPLLSAVVAHEAVAAVPAPISGDLLLAAHDDPSAAIARLQSHDDGLTAEEAALRLARFGPNEIEHEPPLPAWRHLW